MVVLVAACADHGIKIASATRTMRAGASRQENFDFLKCGVVIFFVFIFGFNFPFVVLAFFDFSSCRLRPALTGSGVPGRTQF
jgi:hypothetical protein